MAIAPLRQRPWPDAVPRFVTARNPDRLTLGAEVADTFRRLTRREPMPWQVQKWDTQYELDDGGRLFYREARGTVPRQTGKTTETLARHVHRVTRSEALGWGERPVAAFTMQHASNARSKMVEEWMPTVERSEIAELLLPGKKGMSLAHGKEQMRWLGGGRMVTFPPNGKGAHGDVYDLVDIDEAFAFPDNRAEQGARHTMITRWSPQIGIQSTAGTNESIYLKDKVDDGRERVEAGDCGHVYYLEYSAGPDDDIHNPEHWPRWMPALGYTITLETAMLEHDTLDEDEWARAWCNQWTGSTVQLIPAKEWKAAYSPRTKINGHVWMAVDVSPGVNGHGRSGAISVARWHGKEIRVHVIAHGPGVSWIADKIGDLTRQQSVESLYLDSVGPVGQIVPDIIEKANTAVEVIDTQTMVSACGRFHQGVLDATIRHHDQDVLNAAVEGAASRTLNDGWAFKRRTSSADIAPLVSCTLAAWGAALNPDRGPMRIYVPSSNR